MNTVVTGGAGFIGSNLVRKLLDLGRQVKVVDDFSRGSIRNLTDLGINPPDVGLGGGDEKTDLRDYGQAVAAIHGSDSVFHLAARIGSIDYLHGSNANELEALQSNLAIDANVFRACHECGVARVVYASSVAVYPIGRQQVPGVVFSEDDLDQYNAEGGYGWAKLMGELQLGWTESFRAGIGRIFNIYGENQDLVRAVHVVPSLLLKISRYPVEDFTVWGNGEHSRDFLHVSDCAEALMALEVKASKPAVIVNIGSGKAVAIREIAEAVVNVSGKKAPIIYDTSRPVGPASRTADTTRAGQLLGWQPRVGLDEGLSRAYNWLRRRLSDA